MRIYNYQMMLNEDRIPYLSKANYFDVDGRRTYRSVEHLVEFINRGMKLQNYAEEYVYCICFDNANHVIGCFEVSHGTVNASLISAREIFQKAMMLGAVSIILTHNHPSGVVEPSQADIESTKKVKWAGELLGIRLLDHIIVGDGYTSFAEMELM